MEGYKKKRREGQDRKKPAAQWKTGFKKRSFAFSCPLGHHFIIVKIPNSICSYSQLDTSVYHQGARPSAVDSSLFRS